MAVAALAVIVLMLLGGALAVTAAASPLSASAGPTASAPKIDSLTSPPAATAAPTVSVTPDAATGPHPGTLDVYEVAPGGATSEDPAVAYDTVSYEPMLNVFEGLDTYNGTSNSSYIPVLATCVPGTEQCVKDYGTTMIYQANGDQYTGAAGTEPIYWSFAIDSAAKYYDPSTKVSWGVYPTDVMFSEAREAAWSEIIGVGNTAGWLTAEALLPNGTAAFDEGLHAPYNNTPGNILSSMLVNDSTFCPAAALTNSHGCITFKADGAGADWPQFLQLVDDGFAGAVIPCGWYTYEGAGIPGWTGTKAADGDGPCDVTQMGATWSTSSSSWKSYLASLNTSSGAVSWDSYEKLLASTYPAPDPKVQWNTVGSGPYYAKYENTANPPGYTLTANPVYGQPSACSGAGGLAKYSGPGCYPTPTGYQPHVQVYYEPNDQVGISEYRAGQADFATIQTPETGTMLELAAEGKLDYYIKPSISTFFIPINLDWSATAYSSWNLPGTPNIPADFFSGQAARSLLTEAYPYNETFTTAWTVDGIPFLYGAGGPIAKGMNFYPGNVSFPYDQKLAGGNGLGNPDTNPSSVGGAAWWWAQGTDPTSPYYDSELAACTKASPCVFPIVGEEGTPGLDTSISEFISELETISGDALQPYTFDLPFGNGQPTGSLLDELSPGPGNGPLDVWNLGWAPDNFDPLDYLLPLAFPDSTYTYTDSVAEQFALPAYDNIGSCGFATNDSYKDLVHWASQAELTSACQGVAYGVANYWQHNATHVADPTQRGLDYNLVIHILNALGLYIWYGQSNQVTSAAPWIDGTSINYNPAIGGGGDQLWFQIHYQSFSSTVTFTETGLKAGSSWSVTFGSTTQSSDTASIAFDSIPNGTFPYSVAFAPGYNATPSAGSLKVPTTLTQAIAFSAIKTTATYGVTFNETGLISNTTWTMNVTDVGTIASNLPSITFDLPNGTYTYGAESVGGYTVSPGGGFTVAGAALELSVTYLSSIQKVYDVTFQAVGLPGGDSWSVTLSSATSGGFTLSSTSANITFEEANGSFVAKFTVPKGYVVPTPDAQVTVAGAAVVIQVPLTATASALQLEFLETGLPKGSAWSVTLTSYNLTQRSTTDSMNFSLAAGTVKWSESTIPNYVTATPSGLVSVSGTVTKVTIAYQEYSYAVTFFEGGLPSGAAWNVTVNSVVTKSTGTSLVIDLPNGTHDFTVGPPKGYEVVSSLTSVTVNGAANSTVIVFAQIPPTFSVTFTETGLPTGTSWSVSFAGTTTTSITTTIVFTGVPNGPSAYGVGAVSGYTASPGSGLITVKSANGAATIAFSHTASSTPSASYLSKLAYEVIAALGVLLVIVLIAAAVIASRRPPASPPPKGWSENAPTTEKTGSTESSGSPEEPGNQS